MKKLDTNNYRFDSNDKEQSKKALKHWAVVIGLILFFIIFIWVNVDLAKHTSGVGGFIDAFTVIGVIGYLFYQSLSWWDTWKLKREQNKLNKQNLSTTPLVNNNDDIVNTLPPLPTPLTDSQKAALVKQNIYTDPRNGTSLFNTTPVGPVKPVVETPPMQTQSFKTAEQSVSQAAVPNDNLPNYPLPNDIK